MTQDVLKKLEVWAANNNWGIAHPLDQDRFREFVIEAYKNGDTRISEEDFYEVIKRYYDDEEIITKYYIDYEFGISLLEQYRSKEL